MPISVMQISTETVAASIVARLSRLPIAARPVSSGAGASPFAADDSICCRRRCRGMALPRPFAEAVENPHHQQPEPDFVQHRPFSPLHRKNVPAFLPVRLPSTHTVSPATNTQRTTPGESVARSRLIHRQIAQRTRGVFYRDSPRGRAACAPATIGPPSRRMCRRRAASRPSLRGQEPPIDRQVPTASPASRATSRRAGSTRPTTVVTPPARARPSASSRADARHPIGQISDSSRQNGAANRIGHNFASRRAEIAQVENFAVRQRRRGEPVAVRVIDPQIDPHRAEAIRVEHVAADDHGVEQIELVCTRQPVVDARIGIA